MKLKGTLLLLLAIVAIACNESKETPKEETIEQLSYANIVFEDSEGYQFNQAEKELIIETVSEAEKQVRGLLPELTKELTLKVVPVDFEIDMVGGVTGRANNPHEVIAQISYKYKDGVTGAIKRALSPLIHHEFHHVWRGWTINENKFGRGIDIAAVNEGLADVFSHTYTGFTNDVGSPDDDLAAWAQEVLELPKDANYNKWMNMHDDGRIAVGYRAGGYIIEQAMEKSDKDILELSKLQPDEILKLAELR